MKKITVKTYHESGFFAYEVTVKRWRIFLAISQVEVSIWVELPDQAV